MSLEKVVYTAHAKATGGRDGRATSSDGILDVKLTVPKEMGGAGGGTNPEQLFAAGYSACFLGAMKFVANRDQLKITPDVYIEGDVGIGPIPTGFGIQVTLNIHLEGLEQAEAQKSYHKIESHRIIPAIWKPSRMDDSYCAAGDSA